MSRLRCLGMIWGLYALCGIVFAAGFEESRSLYGIHDHDPAPTTFLDHLTPVGGGWITATVAIGHDPTDTGSADFSSFAAQGHTVICRLNNGYYPNGTIPLPADYDNFARRCSNFVVRSSGCHIWVIGNESNLAGEWPSDGTRHAYVSPQTYAACFRKAYNAIKAIRPNDRVLPQPPAPFAGPFPAGTLNGLPHDPNPLNWTQYLYQMLTAIQQTGPLDGIALHITSRGYAVTNIHSTSRINAGGQSLSFSFGVYKDWVDYGIPRSLYHLPLYATECNGYYYWKGGHPENATKHYEPGWVQEIFAEIDRYNQAAAREGKPIYRCVNFYRWCATCDGWNIDGNAYTSQILADLDSAVARNYRWPLSRRAWLVPAGSEWKYLDDGSEQGTAWRGTNYSDAAWQRGFAPLGYGDADLATLIRSNRTDGTRIITTWLRRQFFVSDPLAYTNLTLQLQRDDGAAVYVNGVEVFRSNLPEGQLTSRTLASTAVGGTDETTYWAEQVPVRHLRAGTNIIAVELHQSSEGSSDVRFDLELTAAGNLPPQVRLREPREGAAIPAGDFNLVADAWDEDGMLETVEFYANHIRLGADPIPPYEWTWTNALPDQYTLHVAARDNAGIWATSAPVRLSAQAALVPAGAVWRYLDNGTDPGIAWRNVAFNDSGWLEGLAELGYGDGDERTVVQYGPNSSAKHITTYFRKRFEVTAQAGFTNLLLRILRDDGAVVFLNGTEVARQNMPAGAISAGTLASGAVGGVDETTFYEAPINPRLLRAGANVIAAEVHQSGASSSDLSFNLELLASAAPAQPRLAFHRTAEAIHFSWPVFPVGFGLESATGLEPGRGWSPVPWAATFTNGWNTVVAPTASGTSNLFFRLRRP